MNPDNASFFGTLIGTSGTTVLETQPGRLHIIGLTGTFVGSLEFYDTNTTAGTAAGNLMYNLGLPLLNQYKSIDLDFPFKKGLTVVATGTPLAGIVWLK